MHRQRRAPQKCLKVKDQEESERRRCVSLHRSVPIRRRKPSVPIRGSNLPCASVIGAHISPLSLQTTAVSPHLQKRAPLQEQISEEAALSFPRSSSAETKGWGRGRVVEIRCVWLPVFKAVAPCSRRCQGSWSPGFTQAVCVFCRCSISSVFSSLALFGSVSWPQSPRRINKDPLSLPHPPCPLSSPQLLILLRIFRTKRLRNRKSERQRGRPTFPSPHNLILLFIPPSIF